MGEAWLSITHHDGSREHVRLTLALTTLGRSEQNVIELLDPKLSRFHCELERRAEGHTVRDCQSRNGTLVNGEPVAGRRLLEDGDRVRLGRTTLTFHTQRPPELRTDPAVALMRDSQSGSTEQHTPPVASRRPTGQLTDRRQTQAVPVSALTAEKPWRFLARQSLALLDAGSRADLIELAIEACQSFVQAKGALLVLGQSAQSMTITASAGIEGDDKKYCSELAARVFNSQRAVNEERRGLALPVRGREGIQGALVLFDLGGALPKGSEALEVLQSLADLVGRTVTSSLQLEELRRDERAAGARRIAQDLRALIRPDSGEGIPGLEVSVATAQGDDVGPDVWDRIVGPERAGRQEIYFALGDVPDPGAPPTERLRRRGERSFVSLLGQAELRGALRSLVAVLPRTSDLLAELDQALRRDACVSRLSLILCRYDPTTGALRYAAAGNEPVLWRRRDGSVESIPAVAPPLGAGDQLPVAEREIRWEPGDQVLISTAAARHVLTEPLGDLFARLAAPAHSVEEIAERIRRAAARQSPTAAENLSLLLLRRLG